MAPPAGFCRSKSPRQLPRRQIPARRCGPPPGSPSDPALCRCGHGVAAIRSLRARRSSGPGPRLRRADRGQSVRPVPLGVAEYCTSRPWGRLDATEAPSGSLQCRRWFEGDGSSTAQGLSGPWRLRVRLDLPFSQVMDSILASRDGGGAPPRRGRDPTLVERFTRGGGQSDGPATSGQEYRYTWGSRGGTGPLSFRLEQGWNELFWPIHAGAAGRAEAHR